VAANGTFAFLNVPAGDYTLIASRRQMEYQTRQSGGLGTTVSLPSPPASIGGGSGSGTVASATAGTGYSFRTAQGNQSFSGRASISVGARDVTDVVLPLKRLVTITGRVTYDFELPASPSGRGSSPVYAEPADGNAAWGMPTGRMATDPNDPSFVIEGLQPGPYTLRFLTLRGRLKSISWDGRDYTHRPLDASQGRDITDVIVTVTDKTTRVNGFAREQNQIATHGSVIFFPVESEQWTNYGFTPRRIVSSPIGGNGSFNAATLPPGTYFAIAVDEDLATAWQDPKFLAAAAPLATRVTIDWGDAKTIDLTVTQVPGFKGGGY
jgi:hypothetical protein